MVKEDENERILREACEYDNGLLQEQEINDIPIYDNHVMEADHASCGREQQSDEGPTYKDQVRSDRAENVLTRKEEEKLEHRRRKPVEVVGINDQHRQQQPEKGPQYKNQVNEVTRNVAHQHRQPQQEEGLQYKDQVNEVTRNGAQQPIVNEEERDQYLQRAQNLRVTPTPEAQSSTFLAVAEVVEHDPEGQEIGVAELVLKPRFSKLLLASICAIVVLAVSLAVVLTRNDGNNESELDPTGTDQPFLQDMLATRTPSSLSLTPTTITDWIDDYRPDGSADPQSAWECDLTVSFECKIGEGVDFDKLCKDYRYPYQNLAQCNATPTGCELLYNGGSCGQSDGGFEGCEDFNGGPSFAEFAESYIIASDLNTENTTYFEGAVRVGDTYYLNGKNQTFENGVVVEIYQNSSLDLLLQRVYFFVECESLAMRYGASQVVSVYNPTYGLTGLTQGFDLPFVIYMFTVRATSNFIMDSLTMLSNVEGFVNFTERVDGTEIVNGIPKSFLFRDELDFSQDLNLTFLVQLEATPIDYPDLSCSATEYIKFEFD